MERPNIVLIMADQLTCRALGAYGNAGASTPNIDKLAREGVVFQNSYCSSPLCAPSRASLVTGLRPSKIGVYDNGSELRATVPTFMHHLRRSGYQCVASGKMHFVGPDQLHGLNKRLTTDIYPAHLNWTPNWRRGAYSNSGTSVKTLSLSGSCKTNIQMIYDQETQFRALEFLRNEALEPKGRPFFLTISYTNPHEPFMITKPYLKRITDPSVDHPQTPTINLSEHHPYNRWIQIHHEVDKYPPSEEVIAQARRAYFGMVAFIDDLVGEVISELELLGQRENTLIVFTSDHGEVLGEHGMWFKRTFFEDSIKVPLILSWPGVLGKGVVIDQVVSLMDLFPTLLEAGQVPNLREIEGQVDGDGLLSMLSGSTAWRDSAIIEYLGEGTVEPLLVLRSGPNKQVIVNNHQPLYFDLKKDPLETNPLPLEPFSYGEWPDRLLDEWRLWDGDEVKKQVMKSQQERLVIAEATQDGEGIEWDYQPVFDASKQYIRVLNVPKYVR